MWQCLGQSLGFRFRDLGLGCLFVSVFGAAEVETTGSLASRDLGLGCWG